jgi:hypothetical protein
MYTEPCRGSGGGSCWKQKWKKGVSSRKMQRTHHQQNNLTLFMVTSCNQLMLLNTWDVT